MAKTNWTSTLNKLIHFILDLIKASDAKSGTKSGSGTRSPARPKAPTQNSKPKPHRLPQADNAGRKNSSATKSPALSDEYPGDYAGRIVPEYAPALDGDPDPGEIVWTWVPYEEDYSQGKDRPVLLVGHDGPWLLGLMLTSKDHTAPGRPNNAHGPRWIDIGSGPWDSQGRDSEIRLDRVLRIHPDKMRREGSIMPKKTFQTIAGLL